MSKQPDDVDDCHCYATPLIGQPLTDTEADDLAGAFKALSDPVRLKLLSLIAAAGGDEVCVCDLTCHFTVSAPTISHHLKSLRNARLVTSERRGTWVYYRVVPERLRLLSSALDLAAERTTV